MKRQRLLLRLYWWELASMDEYSTSLPTGQTVGKLWKRNCNAFSDKPDDWLVGMYIPDSTPGYIGIVWFNVELKSGPHPPTYQSPDWSNYKQWRRDHT